MKHQNHWYISDNYFELNIKKKNFIKSKTS